MRKEDFHQFDKLHNADDIRTITVLGGGFLGTEVASLLATTCNGQKEIQHVGQFSVNVMRKRAISIEFLTGARARARVCVGMTGVCGRGAFGAIPSVLFVRTSQIDSVTSRRAAGPA